MQHGPCGTDHATLHVYNCMCQMARAEWHVQHGPCQPQYPSNSVIITIFQSSYCSLYSSLYSHHLCHQTISRQLTQRMNLSNKTLEMSKPGPVLEPMSTQCAQSHTSDPTILQFVRHPLLAHLRRAQPLRWSRINLERPVQLPDIPQIINKMMI